MKKIILLVFMVIFSSCSSQSTDFEGKWYLKNNLEKSITISKNGDSYIFEENEKKYPAIVNHKMLEINAGLTIKAVIQNEVLILNGKEYLNHENAQKLIRENEIKKAKNLIEPELNRLNSLIINRNELLISIVKEIGKNGKSLSENKNYYNSISLNDENNINSYFKKIKEEEKEINKLFIALERDPEVRDKESIKSKTAELEGLTSKINTQRNRYNEILRKYKNVLNFPFFKVKEKKKENVPDFDFSN